jgi:peptide chain release factor 1
MSISDARLAQIGARFAEMEARLASGTLEGGEFVAASRDYAELEPVARAAAAVRAMRAEQDDLAAMQDDPEMRALAEEELARLRGASRGRTRALHRHVAARYRRQPPGDAGNPRGHGWG